MHPEQGAARVGLGRTEHRRELGQPALDPAADPSQPGVARDHDPVIWQRLEWEVGREQLVGQVGQRRTCDQGVVEPSQPLDRKPLSGRQHAQEEEQLSAEHEEVSEPDLAVFG